LAGNRLVGDKDEKYPLRGVRMDISDRMYYYIKKVNHEIQI